MRICLLICAMLALAACGRPPATTDPLVMVSIRPLELLVKDLAGDSVTVRSLMPPSADPHHFALTAEARQALTEAQLVIWLGPELERPLTRLLSDNPRAHSLAPPGEDVHVWLDPAYAAQMIDAIAGPLAELAPTAGIAARAAALKAELELFTASTQAKLATAERPVYGVEHPAFDRFASSVGLPPALAVNPNAESDLNAGRLAELQPALADGACFMAETESRDAVRLAQLFKLPLVVVDPLARDPAISTYMHFLERVRAGFYQCFRITL